ncbi:MAG TPA: DNA helicase RecQ [Vicinamibacterales bacterium]|nr:DNA helicase RecQ [Vicinamibacterales bacterium]
MSEPLLPVLQRFWGYTSFRPLQREAIEAVVDGRDSLLVLPTGGGKSLCFQVPALVRDGIALVISPLIALMRDQVDTLTANGVPAACYNSAMGADDKATVRAGLREGRYRLLYVAPERLVGEGSGSTIWGLSTLPVSFVAVDEAHCISQWGHDFRPEYRQLAELRRVLPRASMHAFTATATMRVRRDILTQLGLRDPLQLVGSFDRPNLVYRVLPRANLKRQILDVLSRHRDQSGIIYCLSRREVDEIAAWLRDEGYRALPYHAGLADQERHRNQDAFVNEDIDIIVATVAFGMGIDRSDVRFVVHAGAPQSLEHYQQESGRAGRDGLEAECVLFTSSADFMKWRVMLERNGELTEERRSLMRDMERYAARVGCRHRHIVQYFGQGYERTACDACDYCLGELEPVSEPVVLARKILSCVARVGQRFGTAHVTNVLRGSESEQVAARGHQQLSTFGLLRDCSIDEVRGYIDQLLACGLLQQTDDAYPVLRLTDEGARVMRSGNAERELSLSRQRKPVKGRAAPRARIEVESWEGVDRAIFERLRAMRLQIARSRGVPPYVIFHDSTLRELARLKPKSIGDLAHVYGMGARKIDAHGGAVLETINGHA